MRRRRRGGWVVAALVTAILAVLAVPAVRAIGDEPAYRWSPEAVTPPPATMHPGQKTVVVVLARNDGPATWFTDGLGADPVTRLAAVPLGRSSAFASDDPTWLWSSGTRVRLTTPVVPSGAVGAFVFSFTAPVLGSYPADFTETFAPVAEGLTLMDGPTVSFTVRVRPTSSNVPPIPNPGVPPAPCDAPAGCVPTPPPPPCDAASDPEACSPTPVPSPSCAPVEGCLPPAPPEPYRYSVVATTQPPSPMHPGLKTVLVAVLRNEGSKTWYADGFRTDADPPVRLAATPLGRSSSFGRQDPTWLWSNGTRIRLATPVVPPGGAGAFTFTFTAPVLPAYPADFTERFAAIAEGEGLMDGPELTFSTRVRPTSSNLPPIPDQPVPEPPCDAPVGCLPPPPCAPVEGCLPTPVPTVSASPGPICEPVESCLPTPAPSPTCDPNDPASCVPDPPCDPGSILDCIGSPPGVPCLPAIGQQTYRDALPLAVALLYAGSGTPFTSAGFAAPAGVAVDGLAKIVVADTGNNRAIRMDANGNVLFSWGGTGTANGKFVAPAGAAASATAIFVADTGNNRIQVFSLGGTYIRQFGGLGDAPGKLSAPRGISVVASGPFAGAVAVADTGNNRVQILSPTGEALSVVGAGALSSPSSVSVYANEIYVADTGNDRVVRFSLGGEQTGVFGATGGGLGCLRAPMGVVANDYGLFVADTGNDRIAHFSRTGMILEAWGSTGSDANQLEGPTGLVIEATGTLWVADTGNNRLQRFRPAVAAAPPIPCGSDPLVCLPGASASARRQDECIEFKRNLC